MIIDDKVYIVEWDDGSRSNRRDRFNTEKVAIAFAKQVNGTVYKECITYIPIKPIKEHS